MNAAGGVVTPVRVLALWSPDWPVTAAARAEHVPPHRPAAVVVANRVLACSAVARAHGVRRGLRRREAQARCPDLAVLSRDPDRDARAFEPVVVAVEELAPGVEIVRPGLVALPAQGPVGWFGGEQAAAERLVDQVALRTGVECQVGMADGLFAAVLAARRGLGVGVGDTPAFLAPLGVEELDREPDTDRADLVDLLRRLGLRSLGAFAALAAEDVASRFGADAVLAHRLARGLDPRPPLRRRPPEELAVEIELDPPADRVDAAAFAARGLATTLHATLAGHGLSCTRLGIVARTVARDGGVGEELHRIWRCAEPLTPAGTVDRVRWQLDAWLTRRSRSSSVPAAEPAGSRTGRGPEALRWLRLVPEETVTAGALQLGLWGEAGESDARAGRAMVRVQALLGPDGVVTAELVGGRDPEERVRLVSWGDERAPVASPASPMIDGSEHAARSGPGRGSEPVIMPGSPEPAGSLIDTTERATRSDAPTGSEPAITGGGGGKGVGTGGAGSTARMIVVPEPATRPGTPLGSEPVISPEDAEPAQIMIDAMERAARSDPPGGSETAIMRGGDATSPAVIDAPEPATGQVTPTGSGSAIIAAVRDPRPGSAVRDPRPGSAVRDPRPGSAVRDPRPRPAAPDPRPHPEDPRPAPAGWPDDVLRATGRTSAARRPEGARSSNARRRLPARSAAIGRGSPAVRDPPPSWPGRVPAPSPATVPPAPPPVELLDAAGRPVVLTDLDLLTAPPHRVAVDGGPSREVAGWAGPWPVRSRWWVPGAVGGARLQVALDDGTALLLFARGGRWWVTGVYD